MSSIEASGNADLYDYFGIGELNQPQMIDEDPGLSQPGPTVWNAEDFVAFFEAKDIKGSPGEGYSIVAKDFKKDLEEFIGRMAKARENETEVFPEEFRLPIFPYMRLSGEALSIPVMQDGFESAGYRAYLAQIERMLRLKVLSSKTSPNGTGKTLSAGRYIDKKGDVFPLYLLETKSRDASGLFTEIYLRTHPLSDMLTQPAPTMYADEHFFTTGETEQEVLDLYFETIGQIPTSPISEEQIVADYIHRRAA